MMMPLLLPPAYTLRYTLAAYAYWLLITPLITPLRYFTLHISMLRALLLFY